MNIKKRLEELRKQEKQYLEEINRVSAYLNQANRALTEIIGAIKELTAMEAERKKDGKNGPDKGSKSRVENK